MTNAERRDLWRKFYALAITTSDPVAVADKATAAESPAVLSAVAQAEAELGDTGRILLRPSGTEQIVRVMVEAPDEDTARQVAHRVASSVRAED